MEIDKEVLESINNILVELETSSDPQVIDFVEKFPELENCIDYLQNRLQN